MRDHRQAAITLSWPAAMPVNERIIRAKRCIPAFQALPALQLRERFVDVQAIDFDCMPFADALELKKVVEDAGLILEVKIA